MNDCSRGEGVRWVDNYLVGFSHAAQDFGLNTKVSSDLDVTELHNALGVYDTNLLIFPAKYESIVR